MAGQWFSPISYTNKTDRHDITEILLKMALNTITLAQLCSQQYIVIIGEFCKADLFLEQEMHFVVGVVLIMLYGILTDMESREKDGMTPVHIINIDIQDNHEEATIGAFMICDLVSMVKNYLMIPISI